MKISQVIPLALFCLTGIFLIGLQQSWAWGLLLFGIVSVIREESRFRGHMLLLYGTIAILGITDISTDLSYEHILEMGLKLAAVVLIPLWVTRKIYKEKTINFQWKGHDCWKTKHWLYLIFIVTLAYLLLPFYMRSTGAYMNWEVHLEPAYIFRLFMGVNEVGVWDELFFINTVFAILLRFFPLHVANIAQGIIFSSFLYELGFIGWGWIMTFVFAVFQGNVYYRTESLFYVIVVHLLVDLVLFLVLINAHHPHLFNIFITG